MEDDDAFVDPSILEKLALKEIKGKGSYGIGKSFERNQLR